MDLNLFRMDKESESAGLWVELDATSAVKIARANNRKAQDSMARVFRPHAQAQRAGTLSKEVSDKLMARVMAEAVLVDWRGITEDGAEIEPTLDNKIRILETYTEFRDMVFGFASDAANYRAKAIEADALD